MFHLLEPELPVAGELRGAEGFKVDRLELVDEPDALGRGDEAATVAVDIEIVDQPLDDRRPRGRRAESPFRHRLPELFVFHQLSRPFHRREKGRLVVPGRRLRPLGFEVDGGVACLFPGFDGHEGGVALLPVVSRRGPGFLAVDRLPSRVHQDLAGRPEGVVIDPGDARGDEEFRRSEEDRHETADDGVVDPALGFVEAGAGEFACRDDGEVVAHLGAVEDAPVPGLHHPAVDDLAGEGGDFPGAAALALGEGLQGVDYHFAVIGRQIAGIGSGVGEGLVPFVETLGNLQGSPGAETETVAGIALQARQVVEERG